ncbi:MAG: J domain-containing protein [Desulfofustis sp.]|nr:J domain-containing protein [Desulfofustis sp.]
MPKNYYIILGISADSSQQEIKSAYRRLAKAFHPDIYKEKHSPFPVIQEAYTILSDPQRRQAYDRQLQPRTVVHRQTVTEPLSATRRVEVEPLSPGHTTFPGSYQQPADFFQLHRPPFDTFIERLFAAVDYRQHPAVRERSDDFSVDVALTEGQAARGGQVRLLLPARWPCPECGGYGSRRFSACWRCGGSGEINGEVPVIISFPAGISDRHSMTCSLQRLGARERVVTVRFRIG